MHELRILTESFGFFTRAEARELGYDDRAVAEAVRAKIWHRIRRGYYTFRGSGSSSMGSSAIASVAMRFFALSATRLP
jgi:hypothetical protein